VLSQTIVKYFIDSILRHVSLQLIMCPEWL